MSRQSDNRFNHLGEIIERKQEILERYNVREIKEIKYKGYVDSEKDPNNMRIMSLNINGLRSEQSEKVIQLIDYIKRNSVNIALLIETNIKRTTNIVERMRNKIKE